MQQNSPVARKRTELRKRGGCLRLVAKQNRKKTEDNEEEASSHPSTHLHLTFSHLIVDDSDGGRRDCHREG